MPAHPNPETRAAAEAATGREMAPYQGSIPGVCKGCGAGVWIGPAQAEAMRAPGVESLVLCLDCIARLQVMRGMPAIQMKALTDKKWGE